jgi:REP element-mobilizing transposase RayT
MRVTGVWHAVTRLCRGSACLDRAARLTFSKHQQIQAMTAGRPRKQKFKTCRRYNTPGDVHVLTFNCFHGQAFLSKDRTRLWLVDSLDRARKRLEFDIWAYVIMPEHRHILVFPRTPAYSISQILEAIKLPVTRRAASFLQCLDAIALTDGASAHLPPVASMRCEDGSASPATRRSTDAAAERSALAGSGELECRRTSLCRLAVNGSLDGPLHRGRNAGESVGGDVYPDRIPWVGLFDHRGARVGADPDRELELP